MTMKKLITLIFFILLIPFTTKAQLSVMDREYFPDNYIGLIGGIGLTSYNGTLSFLSNQFNCEPYNFNSNGEYQVNV